ncbi:hypothetical protein ACFU7T_34580 [Streptomyces sp. NPDC057555]|uniref:hypothetical protein n=1 Tax=Streptomyces sp. NPDC057555 TaxID=3346166 RepID=UPI0036B4912B
MINKQCGRAAIAVIAAALALSACDAKTSDEGGKPASTSTKPAESTSSASPETPPEPAVSPDAQQTRTLVSALKAVDPALGGNQAWAVTGAKTICADIRAGQADADVQEGAKLRFQGTTPGTLPNVTDDQARRIVDAVKASFCH